MPATASQSPTVVAPITRPSAGSGKPTPAGRSERPGQDYESFYNCLPDAFANATVTLASLRARYGKPNAPEIANWIEGQQAVFSNCGGPGRTPQPAPANAPLWLRQDRAYQIAAAQFYNLDYDQALAGFRAIASDHASPWSPIARYLVARVLIRMATVPFQPAAGTLDQMKANNASVRSGLDEAREQLESILRDPAMKPLHRQSRQLLDFVMARLDPQAQAEVLARRLTAPLRPGTASGDPNYEQNVIDLTYIYNSLPLYALTFKKRDASAPPISPSREPFIRWISDLAAGVSRGGIGLESVNADTRTPAARSSDALAAWRDTRGPQWLVAALTVVKPGEDGNDALIAAARELPATSPAYSSVTYHRLRLAALPSAPVEQIPGATRPVYAELSQLLPRIEQSQSLSTANLFADLQASLSPTLNDFLHDATRRATSLTNPINDGIEPLTATPEAGTFSASPQTATLCNVHIYAPDSRHLDDQTALIFNQRMPLSLLKQAALSPALPPNVRFEVAHMARTRALLLDDTETAHALSPYLVGCQPAFASWVHQYDAARTSDERHVLGLLALTRFTSTEPTVRAGLERDIAAYDSFRDNWWCTSSEPPANSGMPANRRPHFFADVVVPRTQQPDPPFLTAQDRAQADTEIARLGKIPCASDYFARETLAWVKDHPADPHDADLIGFAMRVIRNACRSDNTADLNHQLFDVLHSRFPKSEWAARYTTWE